MNYELFTQYAPIVNAYLTGNTDVKPKKWEQVVEAFYIMNSDMRFGEYADLAQAFKYSTKPTYLCVSMDSVISYVGREKANKQYLVKSGLRENADFVCAESDMRITFSTLRRLVFEEQEHVDAFTFTDNVYQMFRRYEIKMITRMKISTHWSIIERVGDFSKSMQFHNQKRSEQLMKEQPKVYCIVKGTSKSVRAKLSSYVKKTNSEGRNVFSGEPLVPIYETVLSNADDEIMMVVERIANTHTVPYRQAQLDACDAKSKISKMPYNVKASKNMILVDPSQTTYTPSMITEDVNYVRESIKQGTLVHEYEPLYDISNTTSVRRYNETKGEFFDDLNKIPMTASYEDVALVSYNPEYLQSSNTPVPLDSECGQSEADTVASAATEYKPKKTQAKPTPAQETIEEEEDEEEKEEEVKPTPKPKAPRKSKPKTTIEEEEGEVKPTPKPKAARKTKPAKDAAEPKAMKKPEAKPAKVVEYASDSYESD